MVITRMWFSCHRSRNEFFIQRPDLGPLLAPSILLRASGRKGGAGGRGDAASSSGLRLRVSTYHSSMSGLS